MSAEDLPVAAVASRPLHVIVQLPLSGLRTPISVTTMVPCGEVQQPRIPDRCKPKKPPGGMTAEDRPTAVD